MRQRFHGVGMQQRAQPALRGSQPGEDGLDQQRQVLAALAQRRYPQLDHVDAVIQVVAEPALVHQRRQVLVGGRQDAYIHCHFAIGTHRAHRLFLDGAQQLDLHGHRQFGDLVEEQGAAFGRLEQAGLVGVGTGEAAFLVAEELAFHQFGGNRAAVHRHERAVGARAFVVDGARHQLLADAGFAGDVHGGLAAGHLGQGGPQAGHGGGLAQQARGHRAGRPAPGLVPRLATGTGLRPQFQGVLHQPAQHRQVHRFADEIEGTGFQRIHRGFLVAEGGDHGHRGLRVQLGDFLYQFDAGAVAQAHVGQAQRVLVMAQQRARIVQGRRGVAFQTHPAQGEHQQFADVTLVVDDQRLGRGVGGGVAGGGCHYRPR